LSTTVDKMGAAASVLDLDDLTAGAGVSEDCRTFIGLFFPYCFQDPVSYDLRKGAWPQIDNNGNGYVSLAEAGKWIMVYIKNSFIKEAKASDRGKAGKTGKKSLDKAEVQDIKDRAKLLYKRFYPCYIRAFLDAADIGKNGKVGGTKTATKDDYVQRSEFRFLNVYICIYALMYDAFSVVDGGEGVTKDDDRRISPKELAGAAGKFAGHPLLGVAQLGMPTSYGNTDALFKEMDADGKGKVLLNEWCAYLEKKEAENNTELGQLLTYKDGDES